MFRFNFPTRCVLFACLLSAFLVPYSGCSKKKKRDMENLKKDGPLESANQNTNDANSPVVSNVSDAEASKFSKDWAKAINGGDVQAAERMYSMQRLVGRLIKTLDLSEEEARGFRRGANSTPIIRQLVDEISTNIKLGGSYRLVRIVTRGNTKHAVFRMLLPNGGMNYHDLQLGKSGNQIIATRFFVAATGESLHDTMIGIVAPSFAVSPSSPAAQQKFAAMKKQQNLVRAVKSQDFNRALSIYDSLDSESKGLKSVQLYRVMATSGTNDDQYVAAMEEYQKRFPEDPSLALMCTDYAYIKKDQKQLEKCYNDLTAWTGGDDFLKLSFGMMLADIGEHEKGKKLCESAAVEKVDLEFGYDLAMSAALEYEDYPKVLKYLRVLRDKYGNDVETLVNFEGFEGFMKSNSYQELLKD